MENKKLAIIGLGYVGLPLAVEFSKKYVPTGFDLDESRINELNIKFDRTNELSTNQLSCLDNFTITSNEKTIADADIYIITVPTPVDKNLSLIHI